MGFAQEMSGMIEKTWRINVNDCNERGIRDGSLAVGLLQPAVWRIDWKVRFIGK